ncbi:MAG: ROK family protein [Verrucomicrobiia bacterium]
MYLGVEIGGTKLQVGVCDRRGRLRTLERRSVERERGARGILRQIEKIVPSVLGRYDVKAIGVGFGGPFDVERGRAVTSHQIAGWDGFPVRQWFARRFKLLTVVDNDQNCAGFAEAVCGAGRGKRSVFYVTVGTGIGGGLILNGEIYNGRFGAAEIGHMKLFVRNKWRTVESLASGLAIERGVSTVAQAAQHLGVAIANAIALLNPEIVIVGGGVSLAGDQFFRPLRQTVEHLIFPPFRGNCRIVPSKLGQAVVVVGAALLAATRSCSCASVKRRGRQHEDDASLTPKAFGAGKRRYVEGVP